MSVNQRRIASSRLDVSRIAVDALRARSWDEVTVADLAAAAGLSTRTFHRYFPTKRDVFEPLLAEANRHTRERYLAIHDAPFTARFADALVSSIARFPGGLAGAHATYRTLLTTPDLAATWLRVLVEVETDFVEFLTPDAAAPAAADPELFVALAVTCARTGIRRWALGDDPSALGSLILGALRSGLRLP